MTETDVDVLVFSAHPDDTELSAGGTVAKLVAEGKRVGLVDLTHGEMGTRGTPETRKEESSAASAALGATFRIQLDLADGNLGTTRAEELAVIEVIRRHRPQLLIAPYPDDRHPDHTRTGKLLTDVWFYAGLKKLETASPAHRPQAIIYYLMNYQVMPTFVVDVTSVWSKKMDSIYAYASQFYNPSSQEPQTKLSQKAFLDLIEGRGRHFGGLIGADYGEPFYSKQPPRIDDPIAAYRGREV
jgi:bacillithiol biosynthesis deacetylase BshB1